MSEELYSEWLRCPEFDIFLPLVTYNVYIIVKGNCLDIRSYYDMYYTTVKCVLHDLSSEQ